jgi:UrcA family protein
MMSVRNTILAAAALVAAFINLSAAAGPAMARAADTVAVSYADLNLRNRAGRAVLGQRVADAAARLCGGFHPLELARAQAGRDCISATLAAAQPQLDAAIGYRTGTVEVSRNDFTLSVSRAAN